MAGAGEHIAWDMSRYLARPLDLYALDFQPVPPPIPPEGGTPETVPGHRFVVAAFRRDEAVALRDTLEAATGLTLAALDVDAAAVVNAFAVGYPELLSDRTIVVQANLSTTALIRTRLGGFFGSTLRRDAGEALRPAAEAQERAEGLLRCVRGIAESLRTLEGEWEAPYHIFLCGDLSLDRDFKELLRTHLPLPFNLLNPFRNLPGPDPSEHPDVYPGAPFAVAAGLALRLAGER
jgi:Tfp pilus assembly PilM family ATPase